MTTPKKLETLKQIAKNERALDRKVEKLTKELDATKALREDLRAEIRAGLVEAKIDSIRVGGYNFTPGEQDIVETKDWNEFWQWARKDKLGVYVQRRPAKLAIIEQLDAGKTVPGVLKSKLPTLYIRVAAKKN